MNYVELLQKLSAEGFSVIVLADGLVKAYNERLVIYINNTDSGAPYLNNRLAADNADCFDKISRCPLIMTLPVDWDELNRHLEFLASDEGYELSNTYAYLVNNPLPYEVNKRKAML